MAEIKFEIYDRIVNLLKGKKIGNTHKVYAIDEFLFNKKLKKELCKYLELYRCDFNIEKNGEKIAGDKGMFMYTSPLFQELKYYYNNDVCIAISECIVISKKKQYDLRTHSYYYENSIFRVARIWEYLFIILSEFLQTGLIVGFDIKEHLRETSCHNISFIKHENGYKVVTKPLSENLKAEALEQFKNEKKEFRISQYKKSNYLLKALNKNYDITDNIENLLDVYKCEEVKEIIRLRNEIIHRRPLAAKFSIGECDILPGQCLDIKPNGWYDISTLPNLLEKNLYATKEAIKILHKILFYNEVPNSKGKKDVKFECFEVKCNNCKSELLINDTIVDIFMSKNKSIICPNCKSEDVSLNQKRIVNERYYSSNYKEYLDMIMEYWEN